MAFFSRSTQPRPHAGCRSADLETVLAPNMLIGLPNIEKSYAHGTSRSYVLRRITADIKEGEFVSIMGQPSGAGKSTLLHIIGMHDSAWTGSTLRRSARAQARRQGPREAAGLSASCSRAITCSIT